MITRLFSRSALHEHADPAQRIAGVAQLPPDDPDLAALVASDPVADVRAAAARQCRVLPALVAAAGSEQDAAVREAIAGSLAALLAEMPDGASAAAALAADECSDAVRAQVAAAAPCATRFQP